MLRQSIFLVPTFACLSLLSPACTSDGGGDTTDSDSNGNASGDASSDASSNSSADGSTSDGDTETIPDVENADLIDDFEDGDIELSAGGSAARHGTWRVELDDGSKGGSVSPGVKDTLKVVSGGAGGSKYSLQISGSAYEEGGADLGVYLLEESGDSGKAYDASAHDGVSFQARGEGYLVVYLGSAPVVEQDGGGECVDKNDDGLCGDAHAFRFKLGKDWKQYQIRFDDLRLHQEGWGKGAQFDAKKLIFLQFHTDTWLRDGSYDIQLDDIGFFDEDAKKCEIENGPSKKSGSAPFYPFPQNQALNGTRPTKCFELQNDDVTAVYDLWKSRYLKRNTDKGTYCEHREAVYRNLPGPVAAESVTTSEAHGYCMMAVALMAGYDKDAKAIFDELFDFAKAHPNADHPDLMGWRVLDGSYDKDSASDGEFDITYALLLADAQWGGYKDAALARIAAMQEAPLLDKNGRTRLGDQNDVENFTRPSDWMPDHFRAFAQAAGADVWTSAADEVWRLTASIQKDHSSKTGLLPDFVEGEPPTPADPSGDKGGEGPNDPNFSYNACRVHWRLAMDYGHYNTSEAKTAVSKMLDWATETSDQMPGRFLAGYTLDGKALKNSDGDLIDYSDLAFMGPIVAGATVDSKYQLFLDIGWELLADQITLTPQGDDMPDYYAHSLSLLSMLYASGNWWSPDGK